MSTIDRNALLLIANNLGYAYDAIMNPLGDLNRNPGASLLMEAAFTRLRGSTDFHDTDTAANWVPFGVQDTVGLGLQGGKPSAASTTALPFASVPTGGHWTPAYYGPPCPEGFGIWGYNAWKGYQPNPLIGAGQYENNGQSARLTYNSPVRYNGSGYSSVPFFESARWLSFYNNTAGNWTSSNATIEVTLTQNDLEGCHVFDNTGKPLDLQVWYHPYILQHYTTSENSGSWDNIQVDGLMPANERAMQQAAFQLTPGTLTGTWNLLINVPSNIDPYPQGTQTGHWPATWYWHACLYWGSYDQIPTPPVFNSAPPVFNLTSTCLTWARKNFFVNTLPTDLQWDQTGLTLNDPNIYLTAYNRTHFAFEDGQYSQPVVPSRYQVPTLFPAPTAQSLPSSITGWTALANGEAACAILCAYTNSYQGATCNLQIVFGPPIQPAFWPGHWKHCIYFPPVPQDYIELARFVVVRAPGNIYGTVEGQVSSDSYSSTFTDDGFGAGDQPVTAQLAIAWIAPSVTTFAAPPIGDPLLANCLLSPLYGVLARLRNIQATTPIMNIAYTTLVPGARVPAGLAPTRGSLSDPTGRASTVFRSLLKNPYDPALLPAGGGNPAFLFDAPARDMLTALAGAPPSTELLRLDADYLYLTGNDLASATTLELYMEPSDQCSASNQNVQGTRLGRDYTFRLVLEDAQQNLLTKDWYIMASQYYLTPQEMAMRIATQQSTSGYFTSATLSTITEWRLNGYAGLVPDLAMGQSCLLNTRVVAPPDSTQVTYDQFVQNLQNQGQTQAQINEAVLEYQEGGGSFYTEDLSQYSNQFAAVRTAALGATTYSTLSAPYYADSTAFYGFFGEEETSGGPPPSADSVRMDSFSIAPGGYSAGDLEKFGQFANSTWEQTTTTGTAWPIDCDEVALRIVPDGSKYDLGVHLRFDADVTNPSGLPQGGGSLQAFAYTELDGRPDLLFATGGTLPYASLTSSFQEYHLTLVANYAANTPYWIVLRKSAQEAGGRIMLDTGEGLFTPNRLLTGFVSETRLQLSPLATQGTFNLTISAKFVPTTDNQTGQLLNSGELIAMLCPDLGGMPGIPIAGATASINFSALTPLSLPYSFSVPASYDPTANYWLVFIPSTTPQGGGIAVDTTTASWDTTQFHVADGGDGEVWSADTTYSPWIILYDPAPQILGAFRRETSDMGDALPPPNTCRASVTYTVEAWWGFTIAPLTTPAPLTLYPRALNNAGTWGYVRFSRDLWVVARMVIGGSVQDVTVHLPAYDAVNNPNPPAPVVLSAEPVEALVYLCVGKVQTDIATPTDGAPPGDILVLRSA